MTTDLAIIQSGAKKLPDRILLYGTEGIGKSTFAAGAKTPLFLDLEDGLGNLNVPCIPCQNYSTAIQAVENFPTGYSTLVIDTADALEIKIYEFLCAKFGWSSIEDPGYGKGYVAAGERMREFIAKLDGVRKKGVEVIFLAHAEIKNFANPAGPDYSRYAPKMNKNCLAPIKEWCDSVFFAAHDETAAIRKGESKAKGQGSGNRIIHTTHAPAFDAKTRLALPKVIPLSYQAYVGAKNGVKAPAAVIIAPAPAPAPAKASAKTAPITRQEIGECLIEWQNVSGEKEVSATVKKFIVAIGYPKLGMVPHSEYSKIVKLITTWYVEQKISDLPPKILGVLAKI